MGFLGPGPLRVHVDHARQYGIRLDGVARRLIDLGSGGGLPGLPLLLDRPDLEGVLLDSSAKRTSFLVWAVVELGLDDRVEVVTARAEEAAHRADLRSSFDAVVCRGFGPPSSALECGAGFVASNGQILISEPPERRAWSNQALATIGLEYRSTAHGIAEFVRIGTVPASFPRRAKQMQRLPLPVEAGSA